jgi:ferredoxin-NADP reductase
MMSGGSRVSSSSDPRLLTPDSARGARWWVGTVVSTRAETPRARTLVLQVPGWPGHRPGQHVDLRLTAEDGYQAVRSYSIASPPEAEDVALTVERLEDGEVSPYLCDEVRVGDRLEMRGPIGGYFVWETDRGGPLLLVGGGSGVVPLMAMLRHRAAVGSDVPTTLLYSVRSPEETIYAAELRDLAASPGGPRVVLTYTRAPPPDWTGYRRRIDADLLEEVAGLPDPTSLAYVCGPTNLVESVAANLLTLGYAPNRVRTERFGPTGR